MGYNARWIEPYHSIIWGDEVSNIGTTVTIVQAPKNIKSLELYNNGSTKLYFGIGVDPVAGLQGVIPAGAAWSSIVSGDSDKLHIKSSGTGGSCCILMRG